MTSGGDYRRGRHVVSALHVHFGPCDEVPARRARRGHAPLLPGRHAKGLRDFGATLREFNGEDDHVHLLVDYPPKVAVSALVNSLKGVSARRLRSEFTGRVNRHIMHGHFWSPSYFAASCGGAR
jgi:putative transposase